ncbi:zona pellucida sperm-binding protein 1 [Aptenodytes patagonicus]|uniref:zona pellucida sperm-binding protein 1 n=1 Tax=Aptenodytes patagonicus TaxID=9234 RepID=UPI003FA02476
MARSSPFLLLLLLLPPGSGAAFSLLRYRYECGDYGMQLLVYPTRGRTVHFKVMDEFGTRFDVANCSICLHWLNAGADGAVIFSSGYEGCHVLVKEDRYVLRVQLEEMLLNGVLAASYEVNMTCPQPGDYEILTDGNAHTEHRAGRGNSVHRTQADVRVPLSQPGLLHHVSQSSLTLPGPQLAPQAHSEQVHPVAQTQPILVHPGLQPQPQSSLVRPGLQPQPGQARPGLQPQPGMGHPIAQPQRGLIRPGMQPPAQPGLLRPRDQPQPGLLRPGLVPQNQPGLVHPGAQTQPGLLRPGLVPQNQPGLLHPGAQTQPGLLRPGLVPQNQPGLVHAGAQTQAGFVRPGAQPQSQPGLAHPSLQTHSQAGLLRPGLQSQAGLPHPGSQPQSQPGLLRPALQSQAHPGRPRPGLVRPGVQSRPGLVRPGLQAQPQPGLVRPGLQPQAQPGLLRPGLQSQPSLLQSTALFYPSAGAGTQLTREQCQVAVGRMACAAPQGREACLQAGCCYDDMDRVAPCYYGNTATVQCLLDGHFVLVVPRGLATQPYNLDSVRLASTQAGCEPLRVTETFVMFHFPVTQCGTTVQVIEDRLIYENQLISTIDVQGSPRGSITRDSIYILQARCIYNASDLLPLRMEVAVPPTAAPLAMPGPLGLQLRIATDESYSSYHPDGDYPLVKVLRDPVYVEVRLLQKTDPNLVLVLHHCWASPSTDAAAEPQWPILVDGCPFEGDNYRTQLMPVGPASLQLPFPSHYQRFAISTFTFVEPPSMAVLEGEVYISCSASVCHLAQPEPCRPSCQLGVPSRARRSLGGVRRAEGLGTVTSRGRIIFPEVSKLQGG